VYEKPKSKEKGLLFEILIKKILKVYNFRYIIVHAVNSDGFIEGAELIFSSSTKKEFSLTKFQQGFSKLHLLTEDALNWLQQIKNILFTIIIL
jgi:hypothetical protein